MILEDAEAAVLRWIAATPGAKDAFNNAARLEFAVLLYRHAELVGYSRGFAAGREDCADDREKLRKIWEVFGE